MIDVKTALLESPDAPPPVVRLVAKLCTEALLDEGPGSLLAEHLVHVIEVLKAPGLDGEHVVQLSKLETPRLAGGAGLVEQLIASTVDTRAWPRLSDHRYAATVLLSNGMELPREDLPGGVDGSSGEEEFGERVKQLIADGAALQVLRALCVGPGGYRVFAWRVPGQPDVSGQVVEPGEPWPDPRHPLVPMVTGLHEKLSAPWATQVAEA